MKPFPVSDFKAGVDPPADFHLGANAGSCIRLSSGCETELAGQMEAPAVRQCSASSLLYTLGIVVSPHQSTH